MLNAFKFYLYIRYLDTEMICRFRFCIGGLISGSLLRYNSTREARMLQKMLKRGLEPKNPSINKQSIGRKKYFSLPFDNEETHSYRLQAMNKMYMEHITEMLNNGEHCRKLADHEVEITTVRLSNEFNFLNIYFISRKLDTSSDTLNVILKKALAELQAKIGEFSYMARVPYLRFVRDIVLENAIKLEDTFKVMDFGKDSKSVHSVKVCTSDFSEKQDDIPEMRQDVFGVNSSKIKKKIESEIHRFKAINIEMAETNFEVEHEIPQKLMTFNKRDFIKFFKTRRIAETRKRKRLEREKTVFDFGDFEVDDEMFDDNSVDHEEEF